jgi:hypothetical protein
MVRIIDEFVRIWKELVTAHEILSWNLPVGTEENHRKLS